MAAYGDFSDDVIRTDLNYWFGGTLVERPTQLFLGLSRADAFFESRRLDEPTDSSYTRLPIGAGSWSQPDDRTRRNGTDLIFPTATQDWGTLRSWFISTAPTGGTLIASGFLTYPASVPAGSTPIRFMAGALTIQRV